MSKISAFTKEIKAHWNTPDTENGKFVPYKEYLSAAFATGMNYAAQSPLGFIGFGAGCFLIMYHYNLPYLVFSIIGLIGLPLSYLWSTLAWMITDNLGFLPKKTEKKFYIFYAVAVAIGLGLIITDVSKLFDQSGWLVTSLNSMTGINATSFFKIIGIQLFTSAFSSARGIFWRKKLVPKYGRHKYSLYSDIIQKCIMVVLIGWLPVYNIAGVEKRVWVAYLLFSIFSMYDFSNKAEWCSDRISPNPQERITIRVYPVKLSHLLNSVLAAVIPMLGKFDDINFYRFVIPGVFIPCAVITMLSIRGVKERIPQPPIEKKQEIPFWYGALEVMRNKFHWLNCLAGALDTLGNGMIDMTTIIVLYTMRLSGWQYSLLMTFWAFRSTIPTFLAPYFVKRFSYRTLRIYRQFTHIIAEAITIALLTVTGDHIYLAGVVLFFVSWTKDFIGWPVNVASNDMNIRLEDYQMYLSGERLQSFSGIFGWITAPIGTIVGLIIPLLLLKNGFNSNWEVFYLDSARFDILAIPILMDLIGHVLIIIPYIFWDYNKKQHAYVIEVLKQREALAHQGYFPNAYKGGLNFMKPRKLRSSIPVDLPDEIRAGMPIGAEGADTADAKQAEPSLQS